jgi:DNA-binding transcriptional LysR family regulator
MQHEAAQLRLLALVAAHGSLTGAAAELRLTPAALSGQVARAEEHWGYPLVVRTARGAHLTEAGRVLARYGDLVDDACVAARRDLEETLGRVSLRLRIGTFSTAAIRLLPEAMTALRHRHPGSDLSIEEVSSPVGGAKVASGDLDVAVVATYDNEPDWPAWLTAVPLLKDPLVVALPVEHRLAQGDPHRRIRLAQLRGERWVAVRRGDNARLQFDRAAEVVDLQPQVQFETEMYDVAQSLVGTGLGVAVLSQLGARSADGVVYRELERPRLHRRLWALHQRDLRLTPLAGEFVALLRETSAELEERWATSTLQEAVRSR